MQHCMSVCMNWCLCTNFPYFSFHKALTYKSWTQFAHINYNTNTWNEVGWTLQAWNFILRNLWNSKPHVLLLLPKEKKIIIIHYLGDLRAKIQQYGRGYIKIKYGVSGFLTWRARNCENWACLYKWFSQFYALTWSRCTLQFIYVCALAQRYATLWLICFFIQPC